MAPGEKRGVGVSSRVGVTQVWEGGGLRWQRLNWEKQGAGIVLSS